MNNQLRLLLSGSSITLVLWLGCGTDESDPVYNTSASSGNTNPSSTGTGSSSSSSTSSSSSSSSASSSSSTGEVYGCNPVTNSGCTGGAACDLTDSESFACFSPPNDRAICESCDQGDGPWCQGTMTCYVGETCHKYCCDNDDCGPSLYCDKSLLSTIGGGETGICMPSTSGGGGSGGMGGDGGGDGGIGGVIVPGCDDVPTSPPSSGSCIPI